MRLLETAEQAGASRFVFFSTLNADTAEPGPLHARQSGRRARRGPVAPAQHGVRAVDHLRPQRPLRDPVAAHVTAAADADSGRRHRPLCPIWSEDVADCVLAALPGGAPSRSRPARATSSPGPTSSPIARSSSSCSPRPIAAARIVSIPPALTRRVLKAVERVGGPTPSRPGTRPSSSTFPCSPPGGPPTATGSGSTRGRWSRCWASERPAGGLLRARAAQAVPDRGYVSSIVDWTSSPLFRGESAHVRPIGTGAAPAWAIMPPYPAAQSPDPAADKAALTPTPAWPRDATHPDGKPPTPAPATPPIASVGDMPPMPRHIAQPTADRPHDASASSSTSVGDMPPIPRHIARPHRGPGRTTPAPAPAWAICHPSRGTSPTPTSNKTTRRQHQHERGRYATDAAAHRPPLPRQGRTTPAPTPAWAICHLSCGTSPTAAPGNEPAAPVGPAAPPAARSVQPVRRPVSPRQRGLQLRAQRQQHVLPGGLPDQLHRQRQAVVAVV